MLILFVLEVKHTYLVQTLLCPLLVRQRKEKVLVSNYHISAASARTHGRNNGHFILTSWSSTVSNKHVGYQHKPPSKPAEERHCTDYQKNNICAL